MLSEDFSDAIYQIQSYAKDHVIISGETYRDSLIISGNQIEANWHPNSASELTESDLLALTDFSAEIILLGTGEKSMILSHDILAPLLEKQYNVECMSTAAACRTYMVLSAEGRKVTAGLIIEK